MDPFAGFIVAYPFGSKKLAVKLSQHTPRAKRTVALVLFKPSCSHHNLIVGHEKAMALVPRKPNL